MSDTDDIWKRNEVQSPCVKICVIHPEARLCTGCMRSIEEIGTWSRLNNAERQAILDDMPNRRSKLTRRRGGRAARLKG